MRGAVVTFAYNEAFNLPIWAEYYGRQFGPRNLYVIDHGSTDGSVQNLPGVNVVTIPRTSFDEDDKTDFLNHMHAALLGFYDVVMVSDCDEIVVADPGKFEGLLDYATRRPADHATCIGVNVVHVIDREPPLDTSRKILEQRRYARFHRAECKPLLSRVPTIWAPGLHAINRAPNFDPDLVLFHLKYVDYAVSVRRHLVNSENTWSERSISLKRGTHHRIDQIEFVQRGFLAPPALIKGGNLAPFEFAAEIREMTAATQVGSNGFHRFPLTGTDKLVEIPERFAAAF